MSAGRAKKTPPKVRPVPVPRAAHLAEDQVDLDGKQVIPGSEKMTRTNLSGFQDLLDGWAVGMPWNAVSIKDGFTLPLGKRSFTSRRYDCMIYVSCMPGREEEAADRAQAAITRRTAEQARKTGSTGSTQ